ncbi:hypothetical protein GCM10027070_24830 [Barrientosiimonas humi]
MRVGSAAFVADFVADVALELLEVLEELVLGVVVGVLLEGAGAGVLGADAVGVDSSSAFFGGVASPQPARANVESAATASVSRVLVVRTVTVLRCRADRGRPRTLGQGRAASMCGDDATSHAARGGAPRPDSGPRPSVDRPRGDRTTVTDRSRKVKFR